MAQTYLLFDFGADEEKVQQARHKLDSWKQAFRLDKKLQFKFDRGTAAASAAAPTTPAPEQEKTKTQKRGAEQARAKGKAEPKSKPKNESGEKNGQVKLFVRLYFSPHEKLSEQRWVARIPSEEPFKGAAPKVVQEGAPEFAEVLKQFDTLD